MQAIEIKKRIQSTKNTRKITQALRLVAASKMKRFQREAEAARRYAWDLLIGLEASEGSLQTLSWAEKRARGKTLFVLVTSDKGLCGSLNGKLVKKLLTDEKWLNTPESERAILTVGKKSAEAVRRSGLEPIAKFEGIDEAMGPYEALELISPILEQWESGEVKEVVMVSPHYVNAFTATPTMKTYLPFSLEMAEDHLKWEDPEKAEMSQEKLEKAREKQDAIYEPSEDRLIEALSQQLVQMLFIQAFYELKASEYSSRMVAMKKATEAADEMIDTLTLQFNKARQAAITQSLAELAAAGEAVT